MMKNYGPAAKIFFLCFLPVFSLFDLHSERYFAKEQNLNLYISDIIKTYSSLEEVDKDFRDKIIFEIANGRQISGGGSVKFILRGSDGNRWLFKNGNPRYGLAAFRLARLFGVNSPEVYPVSLAINGRRCRGHVQKFIEHASNFNTYHPGAFLEQNQEELIKLQIFHWLINKREDTFYHLMLDDKNKVNTIDLKLTLDFFEKGAPKSFKEKFYSRKIFPNYRSFYYFWDEYLVYSKERGLRIPLGFMCYVENFDNGYVADLLREHGVAKPVIVKLIALKQNISRDYGRFLLFVQSLKKAELDIQLNDNPQQYALNVLNTLKSCLRDKQNALEAMPGKMQSPLNVVTSYFFKESLRGRTNRQALSVIEEKKKEALNVYELLGLYLLEAKILRSIERGVAQDDIFPEENIVVSLSCEDLSLQFAQNEAEFLPEEKRPFVMALYYAIKDQSIMALKALKNSVYTSQERHILLKHINIAGNPRIKQKRSQLICLQD